MIYLIAVWKVVKGCALMEKARQLKILADNKYLRVFIDFSIITLLAIVIFRKFIFTSDWPAGGDVLGWISRAYLYENDFKWLYIWRPHSFGFVEGINSMDFFLMLIYSICGDAATTIKIFMTATFLVSGFTMYFFSYLYNQRHIAALSSSIIYCINPWVFSQFTEAHVNILYSYALFPMVFLFLDRALERKRVKNILLLSLALSLLVTGFHPLSVLIYGFFLSMFVIIRFFLNLIKTKNVFLEIKSHLRIILSSAIICFLLSAFIFIPSLSRLIAPYYSETFGYPIEDAITFGSHKKLKDAFTLRAVESWGYLSLLDVYTDINLPDFPINSLLFLIYILALFTIFFRRDRYTIFFAFSIIISVFISKGPHPPFGYIFTWMWFKIPHFSAFRGANRAAMMTAFSHAFLVSVLVSMLEGYVQKSSHVETEDMYIKAKAKFVGEEKDRNIIVSFDIVNKILKRLKKLLYFFSLLIIISIFLSGFISSFYFFSHGLQVYTPPESYMEPYNWLAKQSGDYKLVTVSRSPSEWMDLPWQESDFASGAMVTDVGWSHDIGCDSPFIHGHPTLQNGGWSTLTRSFVDHLRFYQVRQSLTDDFLKIVGPFNYKYMVLPEYLTHNTRDFFLNQQGYHIVYNHSSLILQNDYYTPRFFAANEHNYVIGGLESFVSLYKIDRFKLNKTSLIFAHQTDGDSPFSSSLFEKSNSIIFINSDIVDAVMLSLKNQVNFIKCADYGVYSLNHSKYWIRGRSWEEVGGFVWSGTTLTTQGRNRVRIPFKVDSKGKYDIWIRIGFASNRGKLRILIDGTHIGEVQPLAPTWTRLMWVKLTSLNLGRGGHTITLINDGTGYNDLDTIAIIESDVFQKQLNDLLNTLKSFSGRIIYVLGAKGTFALNPPPYYWINVYPYEGHFLNTINTGRNISPKGIASTSSVGVWDTISLEANGANDEDLTTRWASKPHETMPQWLQIKWAEPQELNGVHILFERAYADDYRIQTWDGANWVDQANVTENTILERLHFFPTVNTKKLRIFVTNVTKLYDLVSIWELEAFTPRGFSTEIQVPREGRYMFAIRLVSDLDYGTAILKVDNFTDSTYCFDLDRGYEWRSFGPVKLDEGLHRINVHAEGKIEFDQVVVYSLNEGEESLSLDELFPSTRAKHAPKITYNQINPSKYTVHVEKNTEPFLLIFSESYHPMWKAYVDGEEISSIPAYSIVNGFYIKKMGSFDITIYFTGQTYADYGLKISLTTLVIVVVTLIIPTQKLEKIGKYIKHKKD